MRLPPLAFRGQVNIHENATYHPLSFTFIVVFMISSLFVTGEEDEAITMVALSASVCSAAVASIVTQEICRYGTDLLHVFVCSIFFVVAISHGTLLVVMASFLKIRVLGGTSQAAVSLSRSLLPWFMKNPSLTHSYTPSRKIPKLGFQAPF